MESLRNPSPSFARIDVVRSAAVSNYNSLQTQYRRRMRQGLQVLASYTFAKSLDTVSEESPNNLQSPAGRFEPGLDRGPSSFDVRHNVSVALSYQLPSPADAGIGRTLLRGFSIDSFIRSRSSLPVNVLTGRDPFGLRITTVSRPDVVPGVPLYLDDVNAAGGRRFNPAALNGAPIAQGRQGTLGRNVLRGFDVSQVDLSLHRDFALTERAKLSFRADAFNLFNHANFDRPVGTLSDLNFGRSTQMLGSGLGGLNALYQIGGPRSFQLALKVIF